MKKDFSTGLDIGRQWRKFIDQLEANNPDVYKNIWLKAPANNQKEMSDDYQQWRYLVQGAFIEGYEAGFTDRIFKGDRDE